MQFSLTGRVLATPEPIIHAGQAEVGRRIRRPQRDAALQMRRCLGELPLPFQHDAPDSSAPRRFPAAVRSIVRAACGRRRVRAAFLRPAVAPPAPGREVDNQGSSSGAAAETLRTASWFPACATRGGPSCGRGTRTAAGRRAPGRWSGRTGPRLRETCAGRSRRRPRRVRAGDSCRTSVGRAQWPRSRREILLLQIGLRESEVRLLVERLQVARFGEVRDCFRPILDGRRGVAEHHP